MEITVCDRCKDRSKDASNSAAFTLGGFVVKPSNYTVPKDLGERPNWTDLCLDCIREIVTEGEATL